MWPLPMKIRQRCTSSQVHSDRSISFKETWTGHLLERAGRPCFGRRAVVAQNVKHERVVEHAAFLQDIDETADVMVRVRREGRVGFRDSGESRARSVRPRADADMTDFNLLIRTQVAICHVLDAPLRSSCKQRRGSSDQPIGRYCADRVGRSHVAPMD